MTERTSDRIAQALERNEHHISFAITLMEHLVVPTFVLDAEQRVLIWNRACERLTDIPAAEVIGTRDHWRAFYEEPRPCLFKIPYLTTARNLVYEFDGGPHKAPGTTVLNETTLGASTPVM